MEKRYESTLETFFMHFLTFFSFSVFFWRFYAYKGHMRDVRLESTPIRLVEINSPRKRNERTRQMWVFWVFWLFFFFSKFSWGASHGTREEVEGAPALQTLHESSFFTFFGSRREACQWKGMNNSAPLSAVTRRTVHRFWIFSPVAC